MCRRLSQTTAGREPAQHTVVPAAPAPGGPGRPRAAATTPKHHGIARAPESRVETLSGIPMDDVTVHYNSSNPTQVQALAYTQGAEIYVGPGAASHLPHEAWHIVQQRQGRVQPTLQAKGVAINDDTGLEQEADVMGPKALRMTRAEPVAMGSAPRWATSLQRSGKTRGEKAGAGEAIGASREQGRWHVLSTRSYVPVIQRAGHPEDLCFLSGARWIVKRADATETREYQRFQDPLARRPPSVPIFFGPYYDVDSLLPNSTVSGKRLRKNSWRKDSHDG